jgi:hypothetical protein
MEIHIHKGKILSKQLATAAIELLSWWSNNSSLPFAVPYSSMLCALRNLTKNCSNSIIRSISMQQKWLFEIRIGKDRRRDQPLFKIFICTLI